MCHCKNLGWIAAVLLAILLAITALHSHGSNGLAASEPAFAVEQMATVSPEQAWQRLKAGNQRFVGGMLEQPDLGASRRRELSNGQKPFAIVLTCADSRLTPEFIFNLGLGDIFVLRVAGNIADQFEIGSMEYAVEALRAPLIVVLGHDKCGAVGAALGAEKPPGDLGKLISQISVGKDLPAGKEAALDAAIKNNTIHQARLISEQSEVIKQRVARKELRIVSGIYELATGKVEWLDGP
jgi:carbonic anhydrase